MIVSASRAYFQATHGSTTSYINDYGDSISLYQPNGFVRISNVPQANDTTTYKPVSMDATGKLRRMDGWPSPTGSGTITGAGNLNPLFTTGVSGPNITFTAVNQGVNVFYAGPISGSPAAPTFRAITVADLPAGIPNANLVNSSIGFTLGTSGTDVNWTATPISLGATATLNIPTASATNRGALSSGDWSTFNTKVTSVNGLLGVVITKSADSIKKLPVDTTTNRNGYVLAFDSTNHKWYLTAGGGGGGTTYTVGAFNGVGPDAKGFTISGSTVYSAKVSPSTPGGLSTGLDTIAGTKTWQGSVIMTGLSNKSIVATDSVIIRDAAGKLWTSTLPNKVNISDTAAMLAPYLRKIDTTAMMAPYLRKQDTTPMLTGYIQNVTSLSPLFTTANSSHTATFSLSNAAGWTLFGRNSSSSGAPAYFTPVLTNGLFANEGTTTTVLHGNAAGNLSFGAVNLTSDVTGVLPFANGGTNSAAPSNTNLYGLVIGGIFGNQTFGVDTTLIAKTGADTSFFVNVPVAGSDVRLVYTRNDTAYFSRLRQGSGILFTKNPDSSVTIASSGGSGGGVFTRQTYTSGTTLTVTGGNYNVNINPSAIVATLTITLPASPSDMDIVNIDFGGTMTTGTIITALSILPNSGQTIIDNTPPSSALADDAFSYIYQSSTSTWKRRKL
jgi:hypothetical protein